MMNTSQQFTMENVKQNLLIQSGNIHVNKEDKIRSKEFMEQFTKNASFLGIMQQLFSQETEVLRFVISSQMKKYVTDNIQNLSVKKEDYEKTREFIVQNFFQMLRLDTAMEVKTAQNICGAVSVLAMFGNIGYWISAFDDIISLGQTSPQNFIYSSMIFGDIDYAFSSLASNDKTKMRIKVFLEDKSDRIMNYIKDYFQKLKSPGQQSNYQLLFDNFIKVISSFAKYKIPLIRDKEICEFLLGNIANGGNGNNKNLDIISEIFTDLFKVSQDYQTFKNISLTEIKNQSYAEYIVKNFVKEDLEGLFNIISTVQTNINPYMNCDIKTIPKTHLENLFYYANIFYSFCYSYPCILFLNNDISRTLLQTLQFLTTFPTLRISQLFFELYVEIKEMLWQQFHFPKTLEETENYFMGICYGVMKNTMLFSLDVKFNEIERNLRKVKEGEEIKLSEILEDTQMNIESEIEDISIDEYRKNASIFYEDIISIIYALDPSDGVTKYFTQLGSFIANKPNPLTDEYLLQVEAVLFNVRSTRVIFDLPQNNNPEILLRFCEFILGLDNILENKIMISFIIFINKIYNYIPSNLNLMMKTIQFLLLAMSKFSVLQNISSSIINNIASNCNGALNENIFRDILSFYLNGFHNTTSISISYLTEALLKFSINYSSDLPTIVSVVNSILPPCNQTIENMGQLFPVPNEIDNNNKKEFIFRVLFVHSAIVKHIGKINTEFLFELYNQNNQQTNCLYNSINYYNNLIQCFPSSDLVVRQVVLCLLRIAKAMPQKMEFFFNEINKILYEVLSNNTKVCSAIELLKTFYVSILNFSSNPELKQNIECSLFGVISKLDERICNDSNTSIDNMKYTIQFIKGMFNVMSSINLTMNQGDSNYAIFKPFFMKILNMNNYVIEYDLNMEVAKFLNSFFENTKVPRDIKEDLAPDTLNSLFGRLNVYKEESAEPIACTMVSIYELSPNGMMTFLLNILPKWKVLAGFFEIFGKSPAQIFKEKMVSVFKRIIPNSDNEGNIENIIKKLDLELGVIKSRINVVHH